MINLYEKLGILPTASTNEIQNAMRKAASSQSMTLEELQKCKEWLLNPEMREKYTTKLKVEQPEFFARAMQIQQEKQQKMEAVLKEKEALQNNTMKKVSAGLQFAASGVNALANKTQEKIEQQREYRQGDEFKIKQELKKLNKKGQIYCNCCGYMGQPSYRGSGFITLVLLLCGLVPGIVYMIWRKNALICPKCKKTDFLFTQTQAFQDRYIQKKYNERPCPQCGETILKTAKLCKHCGSSV